MAATLSSNGTPTPRVTSRLRRALAVLAVLLLMPISGATAPSPQPRNRSARPAPGVLLIADERMGDPRFRETVILIASHDEGGSLGLVLNRPSGVPLHRIFIEAPGLVKLPDQLYLGGPVGIGGILYLLRSRETPKGAQRVIGDVHLSGDRALLEDQLARDAPTETLRIFTGYAGWGAGQLEGEILRGDWHILRADAETIFGARPDEIWQKLWNDLSGLLI